MSTSINLAGMSKEELLALIAKMQTTMTSRKMTFNVSPQGYIEIFGLPGKGKYSISLPVDGWDMLFGEIDSIKSMVESKRAEASEKYSQYQSGRKKNVG
jgi:hypothetical protein